MIFLGYDFFSDGNSIESVPIVAEKDIQYTRVQSGVFDDLYVTTDITETEPPQAWDYDVVFHATFDGTLAAGSLDFTLDQIDTLRIKRRESGTYNWITIFEIPINNTEDFKFTRYDKYASGDTPYEYAFVPVLNGVEGSLAIKSVDSKFKGVVIANKEIAYHTIADVSLNTHSRNFSVATLQPMNQRYPYVVHNGESNYDTGSCSAFFVKTDFDAGRFDLNRLSKYQKEFLDFLADGTTKYLKYEDGRAWIIAVTGQPTQSTSEHKMKWITSFNWTEVGSTSSSTDLYDGGFIDMNIEGS